MATNQGSVLEPLSELLRRFGDRTPTCLDAPNNPVEVPVVGNCAMPRPSLPLVTDRIRPDQSPRPDRQR